MGPECQVAKKRFSVHLYETNSAAHMALRSVHACSLTVCGCVTAAESSPCSHLPWHAHHQRFMICLNNPSPCFKVCYMNGTAPRRASKCLLSPYHLRRQWVLQQGNAWLYNMPPCSGSRAEIYPGQSRFTSAQGLASCSCRLLWTTRVFPRKPMRVSWDQRHKTAQRLRLKMQKITKLRVE